MCCRTVEGLAGRRCAGVELGEGVCKLLHCPCTCMLEDGAIPSVLLLFVLLASWGSGPSTEGKGGPPQLQSALTKMGSHPRTALGPAGPPLPPSTLALLRNEQLEGTRGCVCLVLKCPEFR